MVEPAGDLRLDLLTSWLAQNTSGARNLRPASGDASFRRYFRLDTDAGGFIVMDAPPHLEPLAPYLRIATRLSVIGVRVPRIYAADPDLGFALLEDFGQQHYLDVLDSRNVESLYNHALETLVMMQSISCDDLPDYDKNLLGQELGLFSDWLLGHHLGLTLTSDQHAQLTQVCERLIDNAQEQPVVFVHRDYHARNLMQTQAGPGVLDFQDAVCGPLTYDAVSLLRDAYIVWPQAQVSQWALAYRDSAVAAGVCPMIEDAQFLRWFDLMGLQRHLKVLGIFARLYHRDGKPNYIRDLPRVLNYVETVAPHYPESAPLAELITNIQLRKRLEESQRACMP